VRAPNLADFRVILLQEGLPAKVHEFQLLGFKIGVFLLLEELPVKVGQALFILVWNQGFTTTELCWSTEPYSVLIIRCNSHKGKASPISTIRRTHLYTI
jgi:hypothetical protein